VSLSPQQIDDFRDLVAKWLDGRATEEEFAEIERAIVEHDELLDVYCDLVDVDATLSWQHRWMPKQTDAPTDEQPIATLERAHGGRAQGPLFRYAAAAVLLLFVGVAVLSLTSRDDPADTPGQVAHVDADPIGDQPVATLVNMRGAAWAATGGHDLVSEGSSLDAGRLALESGSAQMVMRSSAMVTLIGATEIEMLGPNRVRLHRGRVLALVPEMAVGFTIETATHTIVDLGTRFGVEVDASGVTHVHVFEGRVRVVDATNADPSVILGADQAVSGAGGALRQMAPDARRFDIADAAPELVSARGATVVREPPESLQAGVLESATAKLIRERVVTLENPLRVLLGNTRGRAADGNPHTLLPTAADLPAGTRVVSYMLHFDPRMSPNLAECQVRLRFRDPVIGVITTDQALKQTNELFGQRDTRYTPAGMRLQIGLEGPDHSIADTLSLSADRRTLETTLVVKGKSIDSMRILVAAPE